MDDQPQHRIAVVGGGIAGLTAAYLLAQNPANDVVLLEGSSRIGGKLRLEEVAGVAVDVGAEAMLNRRPEGVDLARELDLEVVHPTPATSRLWTRGELRPLPRTLMGVPLDLDGLAATKALLRAAADARAITERLADLSAVSVRFFTSDEGREGVRAYAEKRNPSWVP